MQPGTCNVAIERLVNGDEHEWREFVIHYRVFLQRQACKITRDPHLADDVVQTLFIRLWEQKKNLGDIQSFEAYLVRAVRNTACTYIQKRTNQKEVALTACIHERVTGNPENDPVRIVQQHELREQIEERINHLTPKQREVIKHMQKDLDISTRGLGKRLGCSHKNIQGIIGRVRDRFESMNA